MSTTNKRLWVLGAPDPEMERIESLLRECGEAVAYATVDGERVNPGNAYRSNGMTGRTWIRSDETAYLVECGLPPDRVRGPSVRIDHHKPGDSGYGRPPAEFLAASSIGQTISELAKVGALPAPKKGGTVGVSSSIRDDGWDRGMPEPLEGWDRTPTTADPDHEAGTIDKLSRWSVVEQGYWRPIPQDLVFAAAADHCLGAAYQGECPGIDPDELMRWRARTRAQFQGRAVSEVLADIEAATEAIEAASLEQISGPAVVGHTHDHDWSRSVCDGCRGVEEIYVKDMRRDVPIPELPEAATRLGVPYISGPLTTPDGRKKYTCSGTPRVVNAFMHVWAPFEFLVDIYGDPTRGFAGGYLDC